MTIFHFLYKRFFYKIVIRFYVKKLYIPLVASMFLIHFYPFHVQKIEFTVSLIA